MTWVLVMLRRWIGLPEPDWITWPPVYDRPALTLPWSPLARMVIAINIDKATPGGLR